MLIQRCQLSTMAGMQHIAVPEDAIVRAVAGDPVHNSIYLFVESKGQSTVYQQREVLVVCTWMEAQGDLSKRYRYVGTAILSGGGTEYHVYEVLRGEG